MRTFLRVLAYATAAVVGVVVGLTLNGAFVNYEIFFNGVHAGQLSAQQITDAMLKDPNAMSTTSSLVFAGTKLFTIDGGWLMWLVVALPVVLLVALTRFLLNRRREAHRSASLRTQT